MEKKKKKRKKMSGHSPKMATRIKSYDLKTEVLNLYHEKASRPYKFSALCEGRRVGALWCSCFGTVLSFSLTFEA